MEEIDRYKDKLKDRLADDQLSKVIESLKESIDRQSDLYDEFINLRSQYKRLEKERRSNSLPSQETRREDTRIRRSLLSMINELAEEDLADFQVYREKLEASEKRIEGCETRISELEFQLEKWMKFSKAMHEMKGESITNLEKDMGLLVNRLKQTPTQKNKTQSAEKRFDLSSIDWSSITKKIVGASENKS